MTRINSYCSLKIFQELSELKETVLSTNIPIFIFESQNKGGYLFKTEAKYFRILFELKRKLCVGRLIAILPF